MGLFQKWLEQRDLKEDKSPDYSLDRWVKMAQDLGKNVGSMVKDAKGKEEELDKNKKSAKKDADKKSEDEKETHDDETSDKHSEDSWGKKKDRDQDED